MTEHVETEIFDLLASILNESGIPIDQSYRMGQKQLISRALDQLGYNELSEAIARGRGRPPQGKLSSKAALEQMRESHDQKLKVLAEQLDPPKAHRITVQRVQAQLVEMQINKSDTDYIEAAWNISKHLNDLDFFNAAWEVSKRFNDSTYMQAAWEVSKDFGDWTYQDIKKAYEREFKIK